MNTSFKDTYRRKELLKKMSTVVLLIVILSAIGVFIWGLKKPFIE